MLKKIGFAVVGLSLLAAPLFASADVLSDLQSQVQVLLAQISALQQQSGISVSTPAAPSFMCPQIFRSLSQGMSGSDVMSLQSYLGVSPTGYFGPLTANAVAQFQSSEGISPVGIVGPLTRAALARRCGQIQNGSFSATPMSGAAPLAVNFTYAPETDDSAQYYIAFGDGQGQVMNTQQIYCIKAPCISPSVASHTYTSSGTFTATVSPYIACLYSNPRCMIAQPAPLGTVTITVTNGSTSGAPSISGVDGPTTLQVNQQGTWSVHVNDSSGYLSYSVHWGDEVPPPMYYLSMAPAAQSTGTFSHTYATAGTYAPTFTVTNGNGQSASASATVVIGSTNAGTLSASPTSGTAPLGVHFATTNMTQSPSTIHDWYTVDFGDGTSGDLALPSFTSTTCIGSIGCVDHTYAQSGTYTAHIVHHPDPAAYCPTTNGTYCGSTLTFNTVTITVTAGQTSGTFSASPTSGFAPLTVAFSVGLISFTGIDFGDGQNIQAPLFGMCSSAPCWTTNHTYAFSGAYTAKLINGYSNGQPQIVGTAAINVR